MIQGGDINSKDAPLDAHLGDGDLDYTIPAEFVYPKYFHKRGMLCAARTPDERIEGLISDSILYRDRKVLYGDGAR